MKLHQYPICCVNLFIYQHALDLGTIHFITKTHRKAKKRSMCQKDTQKSWFFFANINIKSGWTSPGCSNSATVSITGIQPEEDGLRRWGRLSKHQPVQSNKPQGIQKVDFPNITKHQINHYLIDWCWLWIYEFQASSVCLQTGCYLSCYIFPATLVNTNVYLSISVCFKVVQSHGQNCWQPIWTQKIG